MPRIRYEGSYEGVEVAVPSFSGIVPRFGEIEVTRDEADGLLYGQGWVEVSGPPAYTPPTPAAPAADTDEEI